MTKAELLRIAKPILFNTQMVQAIQEGKKSVTRRIIKPQPIGDIFTGYCTDSTMKRDNLVGCFCFGNKCGEILSRVKPKYKTGDILYVRETWQKVFDPELGYESNPLSDLIKNINEISKTPAYNDGHTGHEAYYVYKADNIEYESQDTTLYWRPSIHMPKEAARIFLKVTGVRVEQLQDITCEKILKEGTDRRSIKSYFAQMPGQTEEWEKTAHVIAFKNLWDSTIKKSDLDKYGWDANPWVEVYEFEKLEA